MLWFINAEEHFAMVLEEFLDNICRDVGKWPAALPASMRMRYTLLARAHSLGDEASGGAAQDHSTNK